MNFFLRYKKIILLVSFILLIVLMGFALYTVFFKSSEPNIQTPGDDSSDITITPSTGLPSAKTGSGQIVDTSDKTPLPGDKTEITPSEKAQGGLTKTTAIINTPSLGAYLDANGRDIKYYNELDGKFYQVDSNGNIKTINDKIFHDVENVTWSPKNNKAILEFPDGANIIYDFDTNKQVTLPKHWEDFDFSTNGDQIVMKSIGLDPKNRWLAISNEDGSRTVPIESIGNNADTVYPSWSPNGQSIAMYTRGISFDRQEVFFVGLNDENFKAITVEGRGFEYKWEPTGEKLVYSVYSSDNNLKPSLWVVDAKGDSIGNNRKNLKIDTWANKCVFSSNTEMYCAVPKNLEEGAGLFPELAKNTSDTIYKIDINTGLKKIVAIPDNDFNASNLIVSDDNRFLYFTDENSKLIHKIELR